ncbi:MAG: HAD family hydrolase [Deltaproteobacteria bacterium]|jgi:putative hydrolase of the HAD superfamily|nr:HAD family hydrolase [Deltaproteobacteria bacterium]
MMIRNDVIKSYVTPLSPQPTGLSPAGQLAGTIECIFFDIYGTLFISEAGDISMARQISPRISKLKKLIAKFELDVSPRELIEKLHRAIEARHHQLKQSGSDIPEVEIDIIWQQLLACKDIEQARDFAIEYELIANPVYPMPHLAKLLRACRQQNCQMGIISNAQFFTPLLFEWFLGDDATALGFGPELIILSYQLGCAKPSPVLFEIAAAAIESRGIARSATLVVGNDMLNDIYPARQIGFQTALFAGDARSLRLRKDDPRCRDLRADLILTDLAQLIDHII